MSNAMTAPLNDIYDKIAREIEIDVIKGGGA